MSVYQVLRHPDIELDLFNLVNLVEKYAGTKVALRKLDEVEKMLRSLVNTPHIGSLRHEVFADLRAIPVAGKGVICFTVDDVDKVVYIICIAYAGANWMRSVSTRKIS